MKWNIFEQKDTYTHTHEHALNSNNDAWEYFLSMSNLILNSACPLENGSFFIYFTCTRPGGELIHQMYLKICVAGSCQCNSLQNWKRLTKRAETIRMKWKFGKVIYLYSNRFETINL